MKKEQERDKKFEFMWNELQVIIKGLNTIENRYVIFIFSNIYINLYSYFIDLLH